ncbi:MAG TPA: lactate racemase domain-containing protein [Myxococcota bacterium]
MLPRMMRIRQRFAAPRLDDVAGAVARGVRALALGGRVGPGSRIAVGCSSRGIANYAAIVRATVGALRQRGAEPFLVPAMGSHGAASAEGQGAVLARLGVDPGAVGAPLRSSMEVVQLGTSAGGIPVFVDRYAAEADGIVLVNRIKSHTDFTHAFESGLLKMLAVGLGKQRGAEVCHREMLAKGYGPVIAEVAERILESGKLLFGVAVVENAYAETAELAVLPPEGLAAAEAKLLRRAKALAATLPFDAIDLLVIDEIGKDISGAGFDPKIAGRPCVGEVRVGPRVKRLAVRDLSEATQGHATGIGFADFTTRRLVEKIDRDALYTNALTASAPEEARIPLTLEDDAEMIEAALRTIGPVAPEHARVVRIRNTLALGEIEASEAYRPELAAHPELEMIEAPRPMFGADGALPPLPARAST